MIFRETTLEKVFDVVQAAYGPGCSRRTEFSFIENGNTVFGVSVSGWPRIESGMRVIAILGKENDWHTLKGWIDCSTGRVVYENPILWLSCTFIFSVFLAILLADPLPKLHHTLVTTIFALSVATFCWLFIRSAFDLFRIRKVLKKHGLHAAPNR